MSTGKQKELCLALAFALAWSAPAQGQELYLGARGGISVTDFSLPYLSEDWRSGMVAGAFLAIPVGSRFSVQPEISWVRKGAEWFRELSGPTHADLDYIEASALARLSLPVGGGFSLDVLGGPWVGLLSKCGTEYPNGPQECDAIFGDEDHRNFDVGWSAGLGVSLKLGPWISLFDLRWSQGAVGIIKDRPMDIPSTESTQLSLGVGYLVSGG